MYKYRTLVRLSSTQNAGRTLTFRTTLHFLPCIAYEALARAEQLGHEFRRCRLSVESQ